MTTLFIIIKNIIIIINIKGWDDYVLESHKICMRIGMQKKKNISKLCH